ncbi:shikimate kinase [Candidatus Omnitrophota bacterium]
MSSIVLVGFMGTGKTTTGKLLAKRLNREFLELDEIIEKKEGISIREIFEKKGEPYFREIERNVIREVMHKKEVVMSAGGGAIVDEENLRNLKKNGVVVCLEASPEVILKRTEGILTRPLLNVTDSKKKIEELLKKRKACYKKADFCIDTNNLSAEEAVEEIARLSSRWVKRVL